MYDIDLGASGQTAEKGIREAGRRLGSYYTYALDFDTTATQVPNNSNATAALQFDGGSDFIAETINATFYSTTTIGNLLAGTPLPAIPDGAIYAGIAGNNTVPSLGHLRAQFFINDGALSNIPIRVNLLAGLGALPGAFGSVRPVFRANSTLRCVVNNDASGVTVRGQIVMIGRKVPPGSVGSTF